MSWINDVNAAVRASIANATSNASVPTQARSPVMPDPKLHQLETSGDIGAMIAALLMESSKASRDVARAARDAAIASEDAAHAEKIARMKSAATDRLVGGVTSGGLMVASGATAAGGELGSKDFVAKSAKSLEGGATCADAIGKFNASEEDIEKEQAERALTQAKRNLDSAGDIDKDAKDLMRRALSYYADYVRAKDDASKAALFRA